MTGESSPRPPPQAIELAPAEKSTTPKQDDSRWPLRARLAFRWGVIYFALYTLLNGNVATLPIAFFSPHGHVPDWYANATRSAVSAMGRLVGVQGARAFDNGDALGDHLLLLCFAVVATVGMVIWSILDRRRCDYRRGMVHLRVAVRYVLASIVFTYGIFKVFPAQFSVPGPSRIFQTYGQSSPMGLLWTFMGASPGYQMFTGWIEVLGCALLMSRRTTTLGALILAGVLTNVGAMDLCYDVPAKLCVLHLLLMAGFLLMPSIERLVDVLVLNRGAAAVDVGPETRGWRLGLKAAVIGMVLYFVALPVGRYYFAERDGAPRHRLYAAYDVREMRRSGETVPPLLTDAKYWHHFGVDRRRATAILVDGSQIRFELSSDGDPDRGLLANDVSKLAVTRVADGRLELDGVLEGEPIWVSLQPTKPTNESLVRRKVRWFNDGPDIR